MSAHALNTTWYVNDTSTIADSFTSAAGSALNSGLARSAPKSSLRDLQNLVGAGDTIYVDSGIYYDTAVFSGMDTLVIIGADSRFVIVSAPWDTALVFRNMTGLVVENLQIQNASVDGFSAAGINLQNCRRSLLRANFLSGCDIGIEATLGSDTLILVANEFTGSGAWDVVVSGADSARIENNYVRRGISLLTGADGAHILGNRLEGSGAFPYECFDLLIESNSLVLGGTIVIDQCTRAVIRSNSLSGGNLTIQAGSLHCTATQNILILGGSVSGLQDYGDSDVFTSNFVSGGGGNGVSIGGRWGYFSDNFCTTSAQAGFDIRGTRNTVTRNYAASNSHDGFRMIFGGDSNLLIGNTAVSNSRSGFYIQEQSGNALIGNTSRGNAEDGFHVYRRSHSNVLAQNSSESNTLYAFRLSCFPSNTLRKNNIIAHFSRPDSGVAIDTTQVFDLGRSWWNAADSSVVRAKIRGTGAALATYSPFRLGRIDSAPLADTVAPRAPDTVAAAGTGTTSIRVSWQAATASEETETAVGLAGYRIYRAITQDSSSFRLVGGATGLSFDDSSVGPGETHYYRVTTFDNHAPFENEAFLSDSIAPARSLPICSASVRSATPTSAPIIAPDTFSAIAFTVTGETAATDTLVALRISLQGNTGNVAAVSLYDDGDQNGLFSPSQDTFVTELVALGAGQYGSGSIAYPLNASPGTFVVVVRTTDSAAQGDTLQAALDAFAVKTARTESGPVASATSPALFTFADANQSRVSVNQDSPLGNSMINPDSLRVAIAFTVGGDTTASDTLSQVRIKLQGSEGNAGSVRLYADATGNAALDSGDTLLGTLPSVGSNIFESAGIAYSIETAPRTFLVTVEIADTARIGDTFRAYIPALGVKTQRLTTGPTYDTTSPATFTVALDTSGTNTWYVNDASTSGDSFTSSPGSDVHAGFAKHVPKKTIMAVMNLVTSGDTVLVDAGLYTETVVIGVDSLTLVGRDSASTIIDPPGESNTANLFAIAATNRVRLSISSLAIQGAQSGISFTNVDSSSIQSCSASHNGSNGILLDVNCGHDTISGCIMERNNVGASINADTFTLMGNLIRGNGRNIDLTSNSSFGVVTGNIADSATNSSIGAGVRAGGISSAVTGNAFRGNAYAGVDLAGTGNTVSSNSVLSNQLFGGIYMLGSGNTVTDNTVSGNTYGIFLSGGDRNQVHGNSVTGNSGDGIRLQNSSDSNFFSRNLLVNNALVAITITTSANNSFTQNQIETNSMSNIPLFGVNAGCRNDTFRQNNIRVPSVNPLAINYIYDTRVDFRFNHWYTSDSALFDTFITGAGADSILYSPFRLRPVDTTALADTIGPRTPDTFVATGRGTTNTLTWSSSSLDEDGNAQTGIAGYRIYRASSATASLFTLRGTTAGISFADSGLGNRDTTYYRITAFDDNGAFGNESYLSDSQIFFYSLILGDFNADGLINATDVALFVARFKNAGGYPGNDADIGSNGIDNIIDQEDYFELGKRYGPAE